MSSSGSPSNHATHVGFSFPPTTEFSGGVFLSDCAGPPLFAASWAVGVGSLGVFEFP